MRDEMMKNMARIASALVVAFLATAAAAVAQSVADHVPEPVRGQQFEKLIVFEDATGVSLHAPCLGYHSNSYMINISVTNSVSASAS